MIIRDGKMLTAAIKEKAADLGFDLCGIAGYRKLSEHGPKLRAWCEDGMNDKMAYMERNQDKRIDPRFLFRDAKSLVVTGFSYNTDIRQKDEDAPVISRYTYGRDYHEVIVEKLMTLLDFIKSADPKADGKAFVDSAPLLEKAWAKEAGLGWQGKHSVIINKKIGSFFFIGILILNIPLEYDSPSVNEYCGTCSLCIEACPTGAINNNRTIDARKCIANITIENRGPIPAELIPKLGKRIYGCDKCQEVCPWNHLKPSNNHSEFLLDEEIANMTLEDWKSLSRDKYMRIFQRSAMGRVKYENLMRNIAALTGSESS